MPTQEQASMASSSILLVQPCILDDDARPGPAATTARSNEQAQVAFTYPIVDINLVLTSILSLVHVFPHSAANQSSLDPTRLAKALSVAAGRMRSCCGRVRPNANVGGPGGDHAYELTFTDSPIPLHLSLLPSSTTPAPPLPSQDVLHPNSLLEPFLPPFEPNGGIVGPDEPLLACKLTRITQASDSEKGGADVLGIGFHHVLGDADLAAQFGDLLGQVYRALGDNEDGQKKGKVLDWPQADEWSTTLSKEERARVQAANLPFYTTAHIDFNQSTDTPSSTEHMANSISSDSESAPDKDGDDLECIQSLAQPSTTCMQLYTALFAPDSDGRRPIQMTVRLDPNELAALKETLGARSANEAVGAWWIELIRACEPESETDGSDSLKEGSLWTPGRITRVVRMISYRHLGDAQRRLPIVYTPPEAPDRVDSTRPLARCIGNVVQTKTTAIPDSPSNVSAGGRVPSLSACRDIMHALRVDLDSLRSSPQRIERWLRRAAREYRRAVEPEMSVYFGAARDEVVVNAVRSHDWRPDFGLGEEMRTRQRFHTSWTAPRFLRVYRPNPSSSDPSCNGAELGFEALPDVAPRIERMVELHRKAGWRAQGEGWRE